MKSSSKKLLLSLEFLLYAALTALMLHATWLTWPDAYIDFSRELYLPWRVSCGDVLYRDLAYYFGPVSVYVNAALFALLGRPSIHALFALNFAFWMATLLALRAILRRLAHPAVATLAVFLFILLFSFNRYVGIGNYNFLAPYSHELPRGLLLSLLSLLALDSATGRRSVPLALLGGFLLGLVLFTKPEIALAAVFSSAILLWGRGQRSGNGIPPPSVCAFACGVLAALASVLLPLSFVLGSILQALRHGLLKLYLDCFNPALTSLPFFREVMGTSDIAPRLLWLLLGTALALLPFLFARFLLPCISARPWHRAATILLSLLSATIGYFGFNPLNSTLILSPALFFLACSFSCLPPVCREWLSTKCKVRVPPCPGHALESLPLARAFSVFSFILVSKMLLNAAITFYGFVLALPAFCCAILLLFRPPCSRARAAVTTALLLGFSAAALRLQAATLRQWEICHPVHDGACLTHAADAQAFNAALGWIRANTSPGSTLAVLPEGAILNVLSGRPNPTPYVSLPPTDWPRYDEAALLAAYSNSPPDTLVLVRKLEPGQFGIDYAQSLMAFLDPRYTPTFTLTLPTPSGSIPYLLIATRNAPAP